MNAKIRALVVFSGLVLSGSACAASVKLAGGGVLCTDFGDVVISALTGDITITSTTCTGAVSSPATAPGAPTSVTASALDGGATIGFTSPASNGGSAITGYKATCGSVTVTGAASPITVSPLANGTSYSCTVKATNSVGDGAASATVNVTPVLSPTATEPGAPTIVAANPRDSSAVLVFTPPTSNGGSAITGYLAACGGNVVTGSSSPLTVSGLTNNTRYNCAVLAVNGKGNSGASAVLTVTPSAGAATVPGAPSLVSATAGTASAGLVFTAPTSDGGAAITGYTATCGDVSVTGTSSPITVSPLTSGTPYSCSVKASNSAGSSTTSAGLSVTPVGSTPTTPVVPPVTAVCGELPAGTTVANWSEANTPGRWIDTGTILAGTSKAFAFTLSASVFPAGAHITTESSTATGGNNFKDAVIATCPGVFDFSVPSMCNSKASLSTDLTTSPTANPNYCQVTPGQTYYLNIRPAFAGQATGGVIVSQPR